MPGIVEDYLAWREPIRPYFSGPPRSLFQKAPDARQWDSQLIEAIRAYQRDIGSDAEFTGGEAVVATGQQPGLLGGPLYTVYKAATAVRAAEKLRQRFGVPVAPLFWLGSDDHDFAEASVTHILTKSHTPLAIRYTPRADVSDRPLHAVPLEASLHRLIELAAEQAPGSEYRDLVATFLHESLEQSATFAEWTARILARLFRGSGLIIFSPHLPRARRLSAPIFEREIEEPLATTVLIKRTGDEVASLGYAVQLDKDAADCAFFLEVAGRRRKVTYREGAFHIYGCGTPTPPDEMRALLREHPERFSSNVALRCVLQQGLFPVAAYVAGPGEIAYWAQLGGLFERFNLPMPIVYPRASCVLTTIKLTKLLGKLGISRADLEGGPEPLIERVLVREADKGLLELLQRRRRTIENEAEQLDREVTAKLPSPRAASLRDRIGNELDRFERSVLRADDARVEAARARLVRLCNALAPFRRPQERVYSVFSFLFEHGWDLVPRISGSLDIESFTMNEIEL